MTAGALPKIFLGENLQYFVYLFKRTQKPIDFCYWYQIHAVYSVKEGYMYFKAEGPEIV